MSAPLDIYGLGLIRTDRGLFIDKGNHVLNVMHPDFAGGAKMDGVTDDTLAFMAALAATGGVSANGHDVGTVYVPWGTALVGNLSFSAISQVSVVLQGAGMDRTTLTHTGSGYLFDWNQLNRGSGIRDMTLEAGLETSDLVYMRGCNFNFFQNVWLRGPAMSTAYLLGTTTNVSNNDTVTIGTRTYTFKSSLTDVDGYVKIGASAKLSLTNLYNALNLSGSAGTDYATSTTRNIQVQGGKSDGSTGLVEPDPIGAAGVMRVYVTTTTGANVTVSEAAAQLSWRNASTDAVVTALAGGAGLVTNGFQITSVSAGSGGSYFNEFTNVRAHNMPVGVLLDSDSGRLAAMNRFRGFSATATVNYTCVAVTLRNTAANYFDCMDAENLLYAIDHDDALDDAFVGCWCQNNTANFKTGSTASQLVVLGGQWSAYTTVLASKTILAAGQGYLRVYDGIKADDTAVNSGNAAFHATGIASRAWCAGSSAVPWAVLMANGTGIGWMHYNDTLPYLGTKLDNGSPTLAQAPLILVGTAAPENNVTARPPTMYLRIGTGEVWIKTTGTDTNTGWKQIAIV